MNEGNFIDQMKAGNEEALNYLIDTYGWIIKTVVNKHLYRLPWYTSECMNDVLLAAWTNINKYDPSSGSFQNWLAGIAKYTSLNYLRKYKNEISHIPFEEGVIDIPIEQKIESELQDSFQELISCLNPEDQKLFTQFFYMQESLDAISQQTGKKKSFLYNRLSRGKKKIRETLSQEKGESK